MKKLNFRIIITAVLILAMGCTFGAAGVSALSPDGESILSELSSVGTSLGINIDGLISTTAATTAPSYSGNAQNDLADFLDSLGFDYSEASIIEITDYILNRHGTFEDWIHDRYGENVNVPVSVRGMTTTEIVLFLMGNILYPDQTRATTTKYVFSTNGRYTTTTKPETTTQETVTVPVATRDNETTTAEAEKYLNGDVDNDGKVSASDARLTLRAGAGLEKLSPPAAEAADVNGDGRITAKDARSILRYAARLSDGF